MDNKSKSWKKWIFWFSLAVAVIAVYKLLDDFGSISQWIKIFIGIVSPFLAGILISYILYVPCRKIEEIYRKVKKVKFISKRARPISVITVYIIA